MADRNHIQDTTRSALGKTGKSASTLPRNLYTWSYSRFGYAMVEGIGVHGSFRVSVWARQQDGMLAIGVNIRTASSHLAEVNACGRVRLLVNSEAVDEAALVQPRGPYLAEEGTIVTSSAHPLRLSRTVRRTSMLEQASQAARASSSNALATAASKVASARNADLVESTHKARIELEVEVHLAVDTGHGQAPVMMTNYAPERLLFK